MKNQHVWSYIGTGKNLNGKWYEISMCENISCRKFRLGDGNPISLSKLQKNLIGCDDSAYFSGIEPKGEESIEKIEERVQRTEKP